MFYFIQLLRPKHWAKNMFIFLPLFFDNKFTDFNILLSAIISFIGFSFAASSIYCLNDIIDRDIDKSHPLKCSRPIASGKVTILQASLLSLTLLLGGLTIVFFGVGIPSSIVILAYVIMNILYTFKLKNIAIIDVFTIGIGFVMRVLIGGLSTDIELSHWIVLMTFLIAIFLGFAKRRDDVLLYDKSGEKMRKNINTYSSTFLDVTLMVTSTITIICYIMYTLSLEVVQRIGSQYVYMTSLFVIAGFFKYLQITLVQEDSGSPTAVLYNDRFIQGCIILWIVSFTVLIYC